MKVFLNQLLDYNFYCNKELITACDKMDRVPENSLRLFNHLLNAHHIWNCRILGKEADYEAWQEHDIKAWEDIHYENQRNTFEIITNADDFEIRIDYDNAEGRLFITTLQDTLFHIINHSTHLRGQMVMDFKNNKLEPLAMDYMHYKR
ncbi:MAG: damage-inducible protein DinB [Maribacter sp.]|nr:damage-inducible protein DinB [Maribacter sp.]